jgi:hypothetical protein
MEARCGSTGNSRRLLRGAILVVTLVVLAAALPDPRSASAQGGTPLQSRLCYAVFPSLEWVTTCYPTSRVAAAQRVLPIPSIPPQPIVWRLTHRQLRLVAVFRWPAGAVRLYYLFGRIVSSHGVPDINAPRSHYIQIGEGVGHVPWKGMNVSSATLVDDNGQVHRGPWFLSTNLGSTGLTLDVKSGDGRALVVRIARAMLREAGRRGKWRGSCRARPGSSLNSV